MLLRRTLPAVAMLCALVAAAPAAAQGHALSQSRAQAAAKPAAGGPARDGPERVTKFPSPQPGSVPAARSGGPVIVVCQRDSLSRLKRIYGKNRRALRPRLQALRRCHFRSIQSAVNAAKSGDRILLLPGVYT